MNCTVEGCKKDAVRREWCVAHYTRWIRNGDPTKLKRRVSGDGGYNHGYMRVTINGERKVESIFLAEKVLGTPLPIGAIVHHLSGNKKDNRNANLVICQDRAYHALIHKRMRAVKNGYPANYLKCAYCKSYDDPLNMTENYQHAYHGLCVNEYQKLRRKEKRYER